MANLKQIKDFIEKTVVEGSDQLIIQESGGTTRKVKASSIISGENVVYVREKADLPDAVSGVITLGNKDYVFIGEIDLLGDRLDCSEICSIQGLSAETSILKSTGLGASDHFITTTKTLVLKNITITNTTGKTFNINAGETGAYDWEYVNFIDCADMGTIQNISNILFFSCAFFSSQDLIIDGTAGTISFDSCIFSGMTGSFLTLKSTATITRRLRCIFSAIIATGLNIWWDIEDKTSLPVDQCILFKCSFAGAGNYINGLDAGDNESDWVDNKGISNSRTQGKLYMTANATATTINTAGVFEKIAGTTTENSLNQRFSHSNNRLTYTGAITQIFTLEAIVSLTGSNNKDIDIRFAKNGTTLVSSNSRVTLDSAGKNQNASIADVIELSENDYIEVYIANDTDTTNVTATDLSLTIRD